MVRCLETARKGLLEATNRGTKIQIMPALAGRNGSKPWNLREETDNSGPWVSEVADPRSKSKDADFVMKWLTGKDLSVQAAQKVLEVVVVSQAQLLNDLLWKLKGGRFYIPKSEADHLDSFTYNLQVPMAGPMQPSSPIFWIEMESGLFVGSRRPLINRETLNKIGRNEL